MAAFRQEPARFLGEKPQNGGQMPFSGLETGRRRLESPESKKNAKKK